MRFKFENLKNYTLLCIAYCAFALLGTPLYGRVDFFMQQEINFTEQEVWKDVVGYEGLYQVSDWGRVKNLKSCRFLPMSICAYGYHRVCLTKNKKEKTIKVHRLVALAFIPNPENKPEVNHIDLNKINNRVNNLEWATGRENVTHYHLSKNKSSSFVGVCWHIRDKKWGASIRIKQTSVSLGYFDSEGDAAQAYKDALLKVNNGTFVMPKKKVKTSQYKGVSWYKKNNKWGVSIIDNKKQVFLGLFVSETDAHQAYVNYGKNINV